MPLTHKRRLLKTQILNKTQTCTREHNFDQHNEYQSHHGLLKLHLVSKNLSKWKTKSLSGRKLTIQWETRTKALQVIKHMLCFTAFSQRTPRRARTACRLFLRDRNKLFSCWRLDSTSRGIGLNEPRSQSSLNYVKCSKTSDLYFATMFLFNVFNVQSTLRQVTGLVRIESFVLTSAEPTRETLPGNTFLTRPSNCLIRFFVFWSPVRRYLQVFLSLYRANRKIGMVCLQIIFGYRSETGLLAWVRENTRRWMLVSKQERVVNLTLIGCNIFLSNTRE